MFSGLGACALNFGACFSNLFGLSPESAPVNICRIASGLIGLLFSALLCVPTWAAPRPLDPLPGQHRGHVGEHLAPYVAPASAQSGTWAALAQKFPGTSFPDTALLLTDGTVLMHDGCTPDWYKLTPDLMGSYLSGTWSKTASMAPGYKPLYFSSQVLPDGRLIVNGGEYNDCKASWSNLGALYDPVADVWTEVKPPAGWRTIGDAQSVVLADGTYMLADCCTFNEAKAVIDGKNVTWVPTGTGKADRNDEEGWTMLPNQKLLTVDANRDLTTPFNDTEIYTPATGTWKAGAATPSQLVDAGSHEIGPAVLLPNGLMLQIGATAHTAVYDWRSAAWTAGPDMPNIGGVLDSADGPAAVLPNGNILAQVSPGVFNTPSHFVEITVNSPTDVSIVQVSEPASAADQSSYEGRMLVLPTGEILWSSDVGDIQIYSPMGSAKGSWRPVVSSVAPTIKRGSANNLVQGTGFNGLTFGGYYGDDAQMSTNFPIVRIVNKATGHVCYARTHGHATMGISDGGPTSTLFDVPATCEVGKSTLVVVANGIASAPQTIKLR
jgi:hypothetical protein